jgi:hypothetical protein
MFNRLHVLAALLLTPFAVSATSLEESFRSPPVSAKPLIIWQWMNGVVSREGITADLEAFQRAGLGGVQNFQIGGPNQALADDPSVQIGSEKWRDLLRHAMDECARLGLSFGTHNCPGWSSSAFPDVKPEDSMQKLVWTETKASGPASLSLKLKHPKSDPKLKFYRDIAVLALPDTPAPAPVESVIDLTAKMNAQGELRWDAPAGQWIILRFGHTSNGRTNHEQSPRSGSGLECDKLSRVAVEKFWSGYPSQLLALAGPHAGAAFTRIEIDSYEAGPQDWTPAMHVEFRQRRGYDLLPWLPALAKKTLGDEALTKRFLHDWNETLADLFADNYYLVMDELARRTPGMNLLVQPYGPPVDTFKSSGGQSLLCAEFWTRPDWGWNSVLPVASAAHTRGKPLVYGEGFTCWPLSAWQDDPHSLKPIGDRAFSLGINAVMLHAAAQNPWPTAKPGMSFGKWGTQFSPGQTWWENAGTAWFSYLARSQALLQRGLFVGDICYLQALNKTLTARPSGFAADAIGERAFLTRMSAREGRLVLPDGMSYGVLVLPDTRNMTLPVARKLRQLVQDGATILGPKPTATPGLENFPGSETELQHIAAEVWGDCDGLTVTEHRFGQGRVFWGKSPTEVLTALQIQPDVQFPSGSDLRWIHRREADADLYFVANPKDQPVELTASFRVDGRRPELWHADTGIIEPAAHWRKHASRTDVLLTLDPVDSVFVVFRHATAESGPGLQKSPAPHPDVLDLSGPWELGFPAGSGAPEKITLGQFASWTEHPDFGVKHFSGSATYARDLDLPASFVAAQRVVTLDLGEVKNVAEVFVNGERCGGVLWKPPFRAELTRALESGKNRLEVRVTNLWPNRMIGDEHEPDDTEWGEPFVYPYAPGKPVIGRMLAHVPSWLTEGKPRPSSNRRTVVSFKFFTKDSPLLPSGLLGPVKLESAPQPPVRPAR